MLTTKIFKSLIYRFREEFPTDEESDTRESFNDSLSGLEETDPDMEIRNLTRDKLELEIKLLKLTIKSQEDSHPPTS